MIGFEEEKARRNGQEIGIQILTPHLQYRPFASRLHYHEYVELLYQVNGTVRVCAGNKVFDLTRGGLLLLPSGVPHSLQSLSPTGRHIVIKFRPQLLYAGAVSVSELRDALPFRVPDDRQWLFPRDQLDDGIIRNCMHRILHEWIKQQHGYRLAMRGDILRICLWILRQWKMPENTAVTAAQTERFKDIQRVLEYAAAHYDTVTGQQAASIAHMSYSYFCRTFKQTMPMGFPDYLLSLRVAAAERMLLTGDNSITDIAARCGFANSSHFIRQFKKAKGVSPHKYRALTRK